MTTATRTEQPRRRAVVITTALVAAAAIALVPASPAAAHHGWDGFQTGDLLYISGTVSSAGTWGDPHSEFDITIDDELPADTPDLPIPEDLSGPEDSIRVQAALAYDGPHSELEVIIAPPWWSSNNGLDRSLEVGERFQGVGYINSSDDGLFRPVAFWYGDDNAPVNQVIGDTLPVRAPLPGEAAASDQPAEVSPAIEDPVEMDRPTEEASAVQEGASPAWGVWVIFGAVVVVAVIGGTLYVRHRTRREESNSDA